MTEMPRPRVAVLGAGLSGAACAQALRERGVTVEIVERGRGPGGRMASPTVQGRRVDLGAAYFTVKESAFQTVVDDWASRALARPWTDTFDVLSPGGRDSTTGPMRFAAGGGLRSLVADLLPDDVRYGTPIDTLDDLPHDAVVLAMPDPQAARLTSAPPGDWAAYDPVIAVAAGWPQRSWSTDAAFVNDDPDLSFLADDGSRRGDGAAVLVAHSTADRARRHLENPDQAVAPMVAAMRRLLDIAGEPDWTHVHRWTFAKPADTHGDAEFHLDTTGRPVGLCGDSWCPSGAPRVEAAWLSGQRLGAALAAHLTEGMAQKS
ncbi:MAG: NAD(P)-binding protein [Mycobacterium kyogaense]|uniref:NAD(P)/FAD-dependent oxidoreductase n=1 Tax=Mycobacterium kyogaense TaxID=2212479 RepID=UPI002FF69AA3